MSRPDAELMMKKCLVPTCPAERIFDYQYCQYHMQQPLDPPDMVNHPPHYKDRVPGIECIDVTKHFGFCRGNAIKYLWRAGLKGNTVEDLQKAIWYIQKEIDDLEVSNVQPT